MEKRQGYRPPSQQPSWREMGIEVEDSKEAQSRREGNQKLRLPKVEVQ